MSGAQRWLRDAQRRVQDVWERQMVRRSAVLCCAYWCCSNSCIFAAAAAVLANLDECHAHSDRCTPTRPLLDLPRSTLWVPP